MIPFFANTTIYISFLLPLGDQRGYLLGFLFHFLVVGWLFGIVSFGTFFFFFTRGTGRDAGGGGVGVYSFIMSYVSYILYGEHIKEKKN